MDEHKRLKEEVQRQEQELDNMPPSGKDLMYFVNQEKKHASYEKREKIDKIYEILKSQIEEGETMKRLQQEERAMANYMKVKAEKEQMGDEMKRKRLKIREREAKRTLDLQLREREEQARLEKFEDEVA